MSAELVKVFDALATNDFDAVIRALRSSSSILPIYSAGATDTAIRIAADADALKHSPVTAVAGKHPARPNAISDDKYAACRCFLATFIGGNAGGKVIRSTMTFCSETTYLTERMLDVSRFATGQRRV